MGDLLRIDLTSRSVAEETIAPELIRDYVGGKGIGTHYLLDEVGPDVEPLGPDNKLIFVTGPINGTTMFGGNRYGVHFLSPLTNGYGECTSGGNVAPQFARTGYKVVIVEGAADAPVYLEVSEAGAAIHAAADLWGLDTYEAEERMVALHKDEAPKAQACVIGPAGENLVRFACIENNKWHSLGRGGAGAVMGSKKLKGVVFHGDRKVEAARPDEFKALVKDMAERGKDDPGVAAYRARGTQQMVRILNGVNSFPTRYWRTGHRDDIEPLTAEHMRERYLVKNEVCPPCIMQCVKHCRVPDGPLEGLEIDGPEYETIYVFGGLCEIIDFAQIMRLNDICDRLGVDTMTGGNLCALAIEASRRGLIDLELDFGDADGVAAFLGSMCRRDTDLGDLFAEGVLNVEREIPELKGIAVHVKGMEPAGYDPRSLKGMGLAFITTSRGACHLRATFYKAELAGFSDPQIIEGKAAVYVDWEDRLCIMDTLIYCRFYRDLVQWPYITGVVNAAIGTDYTTDDLHVVANRIIGETHEFNARRGFTAAREERLPVWITGRETEDDLHQTVTRDEMDSMLRDYYELRGWGAPAL
jgi:aldehyde:ferredoxin oxidoreductase